MKNGMMHISQKILSLALSLVLAGAWMVSPTLVFAAGEEPTEETTAEFSYDAGSGTEEEPGIISSAETLAAFAVEVDNGNHTADFVELGADIDLSGIENWNPIGLENGRKNLFAGSFDGAGHVVSNMKISTFDASLMNQDIGLFSTLAGGAAVTDLRVENASITGEIPSDSMNARVGVLSGWSLSGKTVVDNVFTSGVVDVKSNGTSTYAGGIVGNVVTGVSIINSVSDVDVSLAEAGNSFAIVAGGVTANAGNSSVVANDAVTGNVSLTSEVVAGTIGGIVGIANGVVADSYVSGSTSYAGPESETAAAVIGEIDYGTGAVGFNGLFYASDATSLKAVGTTTQEVEVTGMAAADMAGDSFAEILNSKLPAAISSSGTALNKWVVSDGKAVPSGDAVVFYNWADLYKSMDIEVASDADYDAVTSATNFASHHAGDIPPTIVKSTDAKGNVSLTGVMLPADDSEGIELGVARTARAAYYDFTDQVTTNNKKYGTDKLTVYLDTTKEGYTWDDFSKKLYAVTISDGTTTVGTLPWIDFYVEGHHKDYVDLALNNGKVHEGVDNGATVNRFAEFYGEDGILKAGDYTVTLYAAGYKPLSAVVPVKPVASGVSTKFKTSTKLTVKGLPSDMADPMVSVAVQQGRKQTVIGDKVSIENGAANLTAEIDPEVAYNVTIESGNYADIKQKVTWGEDAAATSLSEAQAAVAEAQAKIDALTDESTAAETKEAYEALVAAQNAVTEAQADLTAVQERKLKKQIEDLTEQLAEAKVVDITNFAATLDGTDGYSAVYTGKAFEPAVAVAGVDADKYTVEYANNTDAGEATVTITANAEGYKGAIVKKFAIAKAGNGLAVKAAAKTVKRAKVKKAKQTVSGAVKVSNAVGEVSYKKASGSAKLTVNAKTGKITVKKGTKKGTYKAVISVTAAGDDNHEALTKKVTVTIKVK